MKYLYTDNDGNESLTLIFTTGNAQPVSISRSHPKWDEIRPQVSSISEEEALNILTPNKNLAKWLGSISDRVSIDLYGVTLDGVPYTGPVADAIMKVAGEEDMSPAELEEHIKALGRFLEKAESNPSIENSGDLYKWIINEGLTIAPDGDFIGYKGVNPSGTFYVEGEPTEGGYPTNLEYTFPEGMSVRSSTVSGGGNVDGIEFTGYVPNYVGAVVRMPRDKVDNDGNTLCSTGLHVGTFDYAHRHFHMEHVMLVKVNPANVVSVPTDYDFQKLRTCQYTVIKDKVTGVVDERLYIDDVFAPRVDTEVSMTNEETIRAIVERIKAASHAKV